MSGVVAPPHRPTDVERVAGPVGWRAFVGRHRLGCFFGLAYALSWSYWLPMAFTGQVVVAGVGSPTHFPGLLGPLVASFVITGVTRGRVGYCELFHALVRWRVGWGWYAVAAPLVFYAITLAALAASGNGWPSGSAMSRYSGLPDIGVFWVFLMALVMNGFGEETGWRGFALPTLQRRHSPLVASLVLTVGWAAWHLPLFFVVDSFRGFTPATAVGFLFGMTCGAVLLTWVYNGTGGSVLLVALWHTTYNMTSATEAAKGTVAAVVSTIVMLWAMALIALELTAGRRGKPAPLRVREPQAVTFSPTEQGPSPLSSHEVSSEAGGMKRLMVLGSGTAGTMAVNRLRHRLDQADWQITVVDQDDWHLYQPGLLLMPFGVYRSKELLRHRGDFVPSGVDRVQGEIHKVDPESCTVTLTDGRQLGYDYLVVATGTSPRPDQTPGMHGPEWQRSIFEFYTLQGAMALRDKLKNWEGGRLVVHIVDMPIKCPVAPLEFAFLADAFFEERHMREHVQICYVTPMEGAFTKPVASAHLGKMLADRAISLEPDFVIDRLDNERKLLVSMDEREVPFDLLVTVPLNMGAEWVARSGMGDDLNYVEVDKHTLQSTRWSNVFALGDASNIPASKAGSVAHFSAELFVENFLQHIAGQPMTHPFDGHANCFIESGHGKGMLIDFNYDTEPLPGKYPVPGIGPFTLLDESHANHWGKLGFRWAYWHLLLKARPLPIPALMSMAGKHVPAER